jgi:hypothetical protein
MSRFFLILWLLTWVISYSCHKSGCQQKSYIFTSNYSYYPEKDSIRVGDTLLLTCTIAKQQPLVYFSGAENLGGNLVISNSDSFALFTRGAVAKFSYFNIKGSIYSTALHPGNVKQISYDETDSSYDLQVGIIAQDKGVFIFSVSDDPGVFRKGSESCGVANFLFVNANKDKHLYLFENLNGPLGVDDHLHSYCFKVY